MKCHCLALPLIAAQIACPAFAQSSEPKEGGRADMACEDADQIKFDRAAYSRLSSNEQMAVDSKYWECQLADLPDSLGQTGSSDGGPIIRLDRDLLRAIDRAVRLP